MQQLDTSSVLEDPTLVQLESEIDNKPLKEGNERR